MMANKIDGQTRLLRPGYTVRGICTFAVFFSVSRPFCRFTLVYEGHFVLCYKEKTSAVGSIVLRQILEVIGLHDFRCFLHVASLSLTHPLFATC